MSPASFYEAPHVPLPLTPVVYADKPEPKPSPFGEIRKLKTDRERRTAQRKAREILAEVDARAAGLTVERKAARKAADKRRPHRSTSGAGRVGHAYSHPLRRTDVDTDALVAAYASGLSCVAVSKQFGISRSTVDARLRSRGVEIRSNAKITKPELVRMIQTGQTIEQIAESYGMKIPTLRAKLLNAHLLKSTHGNARHHVEIPLDEAQRIHDEEHLTWKETAARLNLSISTLRRRRGAY